MEHQDAKQAVSTGPKILLENERVRVIERHIKAGVKTRMHSHPDMVLYSLKDSCTKYTYPDGTESHIAELISPEESLDIMVELK
jgi:hypothetical protein